MGTIGIMAEKKPPKSRRGDRHKPSRHIRVHQLLAQQLDVLAARNASTAPQEANRAIRELLERAGLWPPSE